GRLMKRVHSAGHHWKSGGESHRSACYEGEFLHDACHGFGITWDQHGKIDEMGLWYKGSFVCACAVPRQCLLPDAYTRLSPALRKLDIIPCQTPWLPLLPLQATIKDDRNYLAAEYLPPVLLVHQIASPFLKDQESVSLATCSRSLFHSMQKLYP